MTQSCSSYWTPPIQSCVFLQNLSFNFHYNIQQFIISLLCIWWCLLLWLSIPARSGYISHFVSHWDLQPDRRAGGRRGEACPMSYDCAAAALLGRGDRLGANTGELDTATVLFTFVPAGKRERSKFMSKHHTKVKWKAVSKADKV